MIVAIDKILAGDGEQIHIQISDTGIGIKNENKDKIFDRFFQEQHISTTYIGSGIGLHIVKEYVTLHGGEIKVEDNHPQGTIFYGYPTDYQDIKAELYRRYIST